LSEVESISGEEGNFEVNILQHPRYVDVDKCIACGQCAEKCPKKVISEYDAGIGQRKSVYVKYAQAVPLKYAIDDNCIYLQKGKCRACEKFCPAGAINFEDKSKEFSRQVGAVIMAPGCSVFDPATYDTFGYKKSQNIVTSLEFERILAATGPFGGHLVRPSDHKEPKKIAWIQCVGSRDTHPGSQPYCSGVCCTYAIKEAIVAKEHQRGNLDTAIFYIDIRTHGKDFERYYNRAKDMGVRFLKSKISTVTPVDDMSNLLIRYTDGTGRRIEEVFDMVVLSVGFAMSEEALNLADRLGIELDPYQHALTKSFEPVQTSEPGIYVCGIFEGPKDIPQSVIESSAAAAEAATALAEVRGSLTKMKEVPEELDVRGDPPRVGAFICCCGTNIAGFLDVPAVVEYAKTLPGVVYTEENLFSCSQDTQEKITQVIKEQKLNRVVVAACTPRTHETLFQETVINAGINKYLFEMANIRNQCSWVHSDDKEKATEKAKDLVRMAVARAQLIQPLTQPTIQVDRNALIIGGGISGMTAAKNLSAQGYHTFLVEKGDTLGGMALSIHQTWQGEDVQEKLATLIRDVETDPNIEILTNTELKKADGFVGNFQSTVETNGKEKVLHHGVAIIATGADEFKPDQYLYGEDPRVVTGLELDRKLITQESSIAGINSTVFIQCVGSRNEERPYCSKVCCTHSVKNAIALKELHPGMEVFIVHRDIRTYGLREGIYREAREKGVVFIRYDMEKGLSVERDQDRLRVRFTNALLDREMVISPDMLVLAAAVVPPQENPIAQQFKVPLNDDGFFVEAHVKLRPVEFTTAGVFVAGLAHGPKPIEESIAQAKAAASRASVVLSKSEITVEGVVSHVNEILCRGCGKCVEACPYNAIDLQEKEEGKILAQVQEALCKGCGSCAVTCPTGAAAILHYNDQEVLTMVEAALEMQ